MRCHSSPHEQTTVDLCRNTPARLGKKFLQAETTTERPRAIVHSCKWGVYHGRLDYFHGKYLDAGSADQMNHLARTKRLPLDIAPTFHSGQVTLSVFFGDEPLPNTTVWIWAPGGKETKQTTDDSGKIALGNLTSGTYSFAVVHTLKNRSGEFKGEAYQGIMHGTTCSFRWPLD